MTDPTDISLTGDELSSANNTSSCIEDCYMKERDDVPVKETKLKKSIVYSLLYFVATIGAR